MRFSSLKRFVIGYIFLVGLPLLGLIGTLRLGRQLGAPIPVDGVWNIAVSSFASDECALWFQPRNLAVAITQSGKYLLISNSEDPQNKVDGELDDERVTAASLPLSLGNGSDHTCSNSKLSLSARIDQADHSAMTGKLTVDGCAACRSVRFTALKHPANDPGEKR